MCSWVLKQVLNEIIPMVIEILEITGNFKIVIPRSKKKKKKVLKQIEILKSYINFEFLVLLSC